MSNHTYYWGEGIDRNGAHTIAGAYPDRQSAEEATQHLNHVMIHMLPTSQQAMAKKLIADRTRRGGNMMAADEPVPTSGSGGGRSVWDRWTGRSSEQYGPKEHGQEEE